MLSSSSANEIVLGCGALTQKSGLLNKLLRFNTSWIGINYLSMALHKKPYMGVDRNLASLQKIFFKAMDLILIKRWHSLIMIYLFKKRAGIDKITLFKLNLNPI